MVFRLRQFTRKMMLPLALIVLLVQLLPMHSHIHHSHLHEHDEGLHFVLSDAEAHEHHATIVEPEQNGLFKQVLGKLLFALLLIIGFELGLTTLRHSQRKYVQPFTIPTRYHLSLPSRAPPR